VVDEIAGGDGGRAEEFGVVELGIRRIEFNRFEAVGRIDRRTTAL
jgi:hypothetical protein